MGYRENQHPAAKIHKCYIQQVTITAAPDLFNLIKVEPSNSTMFAIIATLETIALTPLGIPAIFLSPCPVLSAPLRWAVEMPPALLVEPWAATHSMTTIISPTVNPYVINQLIVRAASVGLQAALQMFLMCSDATKQLAVFQQHCGSNFFHPASCRQTLSYYFPSFQSSDCQPLSYLIYGHQPELPFL